MTVTLNDEAVSALKAFSALPDWLAAFMRPDALEASLRVNVPEIADGRLELVEFRADRLRAKGEEWLSRCRVIVAEPSAPSREVVLVGKLIAPGQPEPLPAAPAVAFGGPGGEGYFADSRRHLGVEEVDPGLPALGALTEPESSARVIEQILRQGAYPGATVITSEPRIARYKPGSRCTILYNLTYEPSVVDLPNPVIAKTHQGDKGLVAHEAMSALWDTDLARSDVVLLAEPLGYLPDDRVLLQGPVPEERTLKLLARETFESMAPELLDELRKALADTARALAALHRSGAEYSRVVPWTSELDEVRDVLDRLSHSVPGLRDAAEPMLQQLMALDEAVPADPVVSAHHDFRPAQVLLSPEGIAFIDFDGAAMAEPGLDLGRFRGKLRDIGISALAAGGAALEGDVLQDRLALLDELCEFFLAEYEAHAPVTRERVLVWETIDLLTALLHTWTKVRLQRVEPRLAVLVHQLQTVNLDPPQ
ncbi:phosphotransferase family protein [Aeromicrobium sp.]